MTDRTTLQVRTITLEMQGIPEDIANHRRSPHSSIHCNYVSTVEKWDTNKGAIKPKTVKDCKNLAVSFDVRTGLSFCAQHRPF